MVTKVTISVTYFLFCWVFRIAACITTLPTQWIASRIPSITERISGKNYILWGMRAGKVRGMVANAGVQRDYNLWGTQSNR